MVSIKSDLDENELSSDACAWKMIVVEGLREPY
jgi:hypothetical protein